MEHSILSPNTKTIGYSQSVTNVLIIGNNPIELGNIYDKLVNYRGVKYSVDYSFDIESSLGKVHKFKPKCIVIDDNLSYYFINQLINNIKNDIRFNHIAFVLLKNSDYEEIPLPGVQEFLLKEDLNAEDLSKAVQTSIEAKNNIDIYNLYSESEDTSVHTEEKKANSFYSLKKMFSSLFSHS